VAVIVGENVHSDKTASSPKKNEGLFIIVGLGESAENAFICFVLIDVFHAPGRPNPFHRITLQVGQFGQNSQDSAGSFFGKIRWNNSRVFPFILRASSSERS
jgi:hypothetical protein